MKYKNSKMLAEVEANKAVFVFAYISPNFG